ncbi:TetR/AcrR family transcriptional regulator [Aeromicrobium sp.]|uniref:TetR/AcrR family transcriptional regulator n=1 Tax=Aeromicrobium sp. TaxID=1871063 RepID=UPI002FCBB13A
MARTIPPDRLAAVIDAAVGVFVTHGYRRTQMQDVADSLGLAKGTLYGYASTKEALFAAAIRYGDGLESLPRYGDLPLPAPNSEELATLVADRLAAEVPKLALTKALSSERLPRTSDEAQAELAGIVTDLYERLATNRVAIKIVDRCASELPDLGRVWSDTARGAQMSGMEAYLDSRHRADLITLPGPVDIVARTTVELCVLWAVHCRFDATPLVSPSIHDDAGIASTLANMITRSMTPTGGA